MSKKVALDASVLSGVVQYMKCSDTLLSKQATLDDALGAEAGSIVDALVVADVLPDNTKSASVARLKEDPAYMIELLQKVASLVQPSESIGSSTDSVKSASTGSRTPDEAFIEELLK